MTAATKKPAKPRPATEPDNLDLSIPEQAFTEAAEAIWDGTDADRMIEALKVLDEPQPRKITEYLRLIVEVVPLLKRLVIDGQGADAEVQRYGQAERAARRSPPPPGADSEQWAGEVQRLADAHWRSFRRRSAGEMAASWLAGLEWQVPKLFAVSSAGVASKTADFEQVKRQMEAIWNWEIENDVQLERRDDWLFTQWRPRERRRRYRLRTTTPPQNQGQAK